MSSFVSILSGHNPGPFTLTGTNCYLIGSGDEKILIDSGEGHCQFKSDLEEILNSNQSMFISTILLTHWHRDHVGGVNDVLEIFPNAVVYKRNVVDEKMPAELITFPFLDIHDGQEFRVEGATIKAIESPGHTPDHCSFLLEEENALFTGDCILGIGSVIFSDLSHLLNSLHRFLTLNPSTLYCGHGPTVSNAIAKIQECIDHRLAREREILQFLQSQGSKKCTVQDLVAHIYQNLTNEKLVKAAHNNVSLHLIKLVKEQLVGKAGLDLYFALL